MIRKIVKIDEEKCNGCGLCIGKCAEGALQLVDGKARLVSDVYCDGLGACLGECPQDAITVEEREAEAFDEEAVHVYLAKRGQSEAEKPEPTACACPGTAMRSFAGPQAQEEVRPSGPSAESRLANWPVQLRLVPPMAPYLRDADILVCADCAPFAFPDLHERYLKGRVVLIGCPKLDDLPYYVEKLKDIFGIARPRSVTVLRMEVPCCGGIARAVEIARDAAMPELPVEVVTVGIRGETSSEVLPAVA